MNAVHNPADIDTLALEASVQTLQDSVDDLQADVTVIRAVTDAIPTLTETGGTLTTDGTEQNVYVNNAPAGLFRPICVKVDFTNHTATETVVLRVYYRIASGGDMILQDEETIVALPTFTLVNIGLEPNRYGVQVTIEKTAGTNRAYQWAAYYEV